MTTIVIRRLTLFMEGYHHITMVIMLTTVVLDILHLWSRDRVFKSSGKRIVEEGLGPREPKPMCCASVVGAQKGWYMENVYRLQGHPQHFLLQTNYIHFNV